MNLYVNLYVNLYASCSRYDVYIYAPDGRKLRSSNEVRTYLEEKGITNINPEKIDFRVEGSGRLKNPGETGRTCILKRPPNNPEKPAPKDDDLNELLNDSSDDEWIPGMMKN